ncbi:MAG TPA: GIY-YIG nuclease family protein [Candidatus Paceibacterota bacterium]|nr:GIY-YIG nuclease family protein [Candidatus Paceibacterota bacterium]
MRYVYVLRSVKSKTLYVGSTDNVARRIREHNEGFSKFTRRHVPWQCVYLEGYAAPEDAYERESQLKRFQNSFTQLKRRLRHTLGGG